MKSVEGRALEVGEGHGFSEVIFCLVVSYGFILEALSMVLRCS